MLALGLGRQASVNPKAETVEELKARRKNLHMGMLKLSKEDLHHTLQAALNAFQVLTSTSHTHWHTLHVDVECVFVKIEKEIVGQLPTAAGELLWESQVATGLQH